jgi:hypothetical protein
MARSKKLWGIMAWSAHFKFCFMKTGTGTIASWSQRPRCLRHELSSSARTLGSWVRIPFKARMSVLPCVQVAAFRWAEPQSKVFYCLCKRPRNWKSGQGPTKGCRATDGLNHHNYLFQFIIIFVLAEIFSGEWIWIFCYYRNFSVPFKFIHATIRSRIDITIT